MSAHTDIYLKFDTEAQASEALFTTQGEDVAPNFTNIDTIGVIYEPTGEGEQMSPLPGWHVNVRVLEGEDATALEPFRVYPTSPVRGWF
jgi:hypothetical protein